VTQQPGPDVDDPKFWRKRAEEVRTLLRAEDPRFHEQLEKIAQAYERLARHAQARRKHQGTH